MIISFLRDIGLRLIVLPSIAWRPRRGTVRSSAVHGEGAQAELEHSNSETNEDQSLIPEDLRAQYAIRFLENYGPIYLMALCVMYVLFSMTASFPQLVADLWIAIGLMVYYIGTNDMAELELQTRERSEPCS